MANRGTIYPGRHGSGNISKENRQFGQGFTRLQKRYRLGTFAIIGWFLGNGELVSDVVHKKDGGRVEGEIVESKSNDTTLFLKTSFGTAQVARDDIARIETSANFKADYVQQKNSTPPTADGEYELALWCLERKLMTEYRLHLNQVIERDVDHPQARKRLGYVQRDGKWLSEDEARSADGYVKFRGKWVLPQERAQLEADRSKDSRRQDYGRKIRLAQKGLHQTDKPDRVESAIEDLLEITDAVAIPLLMNLLGKKGTEGDRAVLVRVLRGIEGDESTAALVTLCLEDSSPSNRDDSIDALAARNSPALLGRFVKELKSNDNNHVRRAGVALRTLGDKSVVPALVEGLITRHERVYDPSFEEKLAGINGTSVKATQTEILPDGTMIRRNLLQGQNAQQAFAPNVPQRQVIVETKQNEEVLDSLISLTQKNFGYDQEAWRLWLAREYRDEAAGQAKP
jgi:hypothetical protein